MPNEMKPEEPITFPLISVLDYKKFVFDFFGKGIVKEEPGCVTLYVSKVPDPYKMSLVDWNKEAGLTVRFWKLPWYRCIFKKVQHEKWY